MSNFYVLFAGFRWYWMACQSARNACNYWIFRLIGWYEQILVGNFSAILVRMRSPVRIWLSAPEKVRFLWKTDLFHNFLLYFILELYQLRTDCVHVIFHFLNYTLETRLQKVSKSILLDK